MRTVSACIRIGLALLFAALMTCYGPVSGAVASTTVDPQADAALAHQQAYCQSITSLEFESKAVLKMSEQVKDRHQLQTNKAVWDLRFVSAGVKYRAEINTIDHGTGDPMTITSAYNGELYQWMRGPTEPTLSVSRSRKTGNMYGGLHPLVMAFAYAFLPGEDLSLAQLQDADKWAALREMVTGSKKASMFGHDGVTLTLRTPSGCGSGDVYYEVFLASDLGYLPMHWAAQQQDGVVSILQVTNMQAFDDEQACISIPTSIVGEDYLADGTLAQEMFIDVLPETLKVNQSVDEALFTIPLSSASTYEDGDTGVTIKP